MVEPVSLQQILSMSTHVEKVQHVHQNQQDVTARNIAQDVRAALDEKKIEVPVQEEGSGIKSTDDHTRQRPNRERKNKQQKGDRINSVENGEHGNRVNIVV